MSERAAAPGGWFRRLFRGAGAGPPPYAGTPTHGRLAPILAALERRTCASVWVQAAIDAAATDEDRPLFGRRLAPPGCVDPRAGIAVSSGLALTGVRAAAIVTIDALPALAEVVASAVVRRSPFVVHASSERAGHGGFHAVASAGALTLFARDPQQAIDLALVARTIAERALVPAVIAVDAPDAEVDVLVPPDDLIREFVGDPASEIESPTPSQVLLFGDRRRTLPRWYDLDRPVAVGVEPTGADRDAAVAGRRAFFGDHLGTIAEQALEAFASLTGRSHARLTRSGPTGAKHVVVAQGSAVGIVEQVVRELGERVAVVGLTWNRPFPRADLREALRGATTITVLERIDEPEFGDPPLVRDVAAALPDGSVRLLSATFRRIEASQVAAVIRNMAKGPDAKVAVRLGVPPAAGPSAFPKRQALRDRIARHYPELDDRVLSSAESRPPATVTRSEGTEALPAPAELPWMIRRFDRVAETYDSVPRFWGEFTEPRRASDEGSPPDPYLSLGAVPVCTATFHDRAAERTQAPAIDAERCTACGVCWASCPDSSIAPVASSVEGALDAAFAACAGEQASDPAVGKLRRALRQVAGRIEGRLAETSARRFDASEWDEAYAWVVPRLGVGDTERGALDEVAARMRAFLAPLPFSVAPRLFHARHAQQKGSGSLLLLAVNPRTCQGCGVCAEVCPDDAIAIVAPQTAEATAAMERSWRGWEALPDTPASVIASAADDPAVGALPAILLSRHCLFSLTGADGAEKGSGERLAARQITAIAEYELQRRILRHVGELDSLEARVREGIGTSLSRGLPTEDLRRLDEALTGVPTMSGREAHLADVAARVDSLGPTAGVDVARVRDLVRLALRLERARWRATAGVQGIGRSRYALLIAGATTAAWAAAFPRNPFSVPLTVDLEGGGPDFAIGLLEGLAAELVDDLRDVRLANLLLEAPADLPARRRRIEEMTWGDLTDDERSLCPPLVVLGRWDAIASIGLGGWSRCLSSDLPVKIVLLDDRDLGVAGTDPTLLALAHRRAFVLSSSIAHPDHMFAGFRAALEFSGPAFVHVHAPSPSRHGFPTEQTVARARIAVASRVHPLLRYDPRASGVFGSRLSLEGNPSPASDWTRDAEGRPVTPEAWADGEARFASGGTKLREAAVGERADHWRTLQELAGIVTPFTEAVRAQVRAELAEEHAREVERLRSEEEDRVVTLDAERAARLRARLLELAGFATPRPGSEGGRS